MIYTIAKQLYAFANKCYAKDKHHARQKAEACIDLFDGKVKELLEDIAVMPCAQKHGEGKAEIVQLFVK